MKKITFGLVGLALILGALAAPVSASTQTLSFTPVQVARLQQLVTLWLQLRQMSIRSLARQNPPASLMATSSIPRNNTASILLFSR